MHKICPQKICLGGSFNPIHHGHLLCARAVAEAVGAKKVVLFPTGIAPHKQHATEVAPIVDRLEMCHRAVAEAADFELDDRETLRAGPSYTIQTVRELRKEGCGEIAWIIGADLLAGLPNWHEAQLLLNEVKFIVMARPGWSFDWGSLPGEFQKLREQVVQVPQIDISGTDIRRRVKDGLPIDFLTPPGVCDYIRKQNLYR